MVATWVIIGLVFSAFSVSTLGAAFSIFGLRDLFSGAALAVILMAASLEFAKFTLAAYLHQRWKVLHKIFKGYLVSAVAILSLITSMGIYGFLSNAYQSASAVFEKSNLELTALEGQQSRNQAEVARLNKMVDEIPPSRVTKRMEMRKEIEPAMAEINKSIASVAAQIDEAKLKVHDVQQKVGPLIYISRAFNVNIDNVVKYLILILVLVFDPLAISLVIASSEALTARSRKDSSQSTAFGFETPAQPSAQPTAPVVASVPPPQQPSDEEVVHMRFASDEDQKAV